MSRHHADRFAALRAIGSLVRFPVGRIEHADYVRLPSSLSIASGTRWFALLPDSGVIPFPRRAPC